MTDTTNDINDIDVLLEYLTVAANQHWIRIPRGVAADYHAALTALVAERDALRNERQMYWESCDALEKQTIDLKARVAELEAQNSSDCEMTERECEVRCKALVAEQERLKTQRDEARRLYCVEMSRQSFDPKRFTPEWGANELGWDCWAQKEGGGA